MGSRRDMCLNLLGGFDLFCLATRKEAMEPFVEAAAAGLAVIGTDAGVWANRWWHGETGLLVKLDDAAGLTAVLARLVDSPTGAPENGEAGHARIGAGNVHPETLARADLKKSTGAGLASAARVAASI